MILPVVINLEIVSDYDHLNVFYYYMSALKAQESKAIVSHERYFMNMEAASQRGFTKETLKGASEILEFDLPTDYTLNQIGKYYIKQEFEDEIISQFDCRLSAWTSLLKENHNELEIYLGCLLDEISRDFKEDIEAILCFHCPVALREAARKRSIPIAHQEMTMFRPPVYLKAGYFDFKESYGVGELESRYNSFMEQYNLLREDKSIIFLSNKEILSLFMLPEFIKDIHLMDNAPTYEIGIGMYSFNTGMLFKDGLVNSDEILFDARKKYPENSILQRARINPSAGMDQSVSSYHFITKCKRIAALHSNILFEALLLNRCSCAYGKSPFGFMCNRGVADQTDKIVPRSFINFVVFGYFVPWELITDWDYIRFRLSNPSETQIYNKHLEYILNKRGVDFRILKEEENRLKNILCMQGFDFEGNYIVSNEAVENKEVEAVENTVNLSPIPAKQQTNPDTAKEMYEHYEEKCRCLEKQVSEITQEIENFAGIKDEYDNLLIVYKNLQESYLQVEKLYSEALDKSFKRRVKKLFLGRN